jgi:hypothetical protein
MTWIIEVNQHGVFTYLKSHDGPSTYQFRSLEIAIKDIESWEDKWEMFSGEQLRFDL